MLTLPRWRTQPNGCKVRGFLLDVFGIVRPTMQLGRVWSAFDRDGRVIAEGPETGDEGVAACDLALSEHWALES